MNASELFSGMQRLADRHHPTANTLDDMDEDMRFWAAQGGPLKRWRRRRELRDHLVLTEALRREQGLQ